MKPIIHNAVYTALTEQPERRIDGYLWVSDLGKNPYGAVKRLMTGQLEPFDYPTLLKMDGGSALEAVTLRQIAENIDRPVRTQFPLFDEIWSGYADIVIGHGSGDVIIYDHKGSAGKWWDYKESLPRTSDCLQVWKYGRLYESIYGIKPAVGLYYRGWGTWAEFKITPMEDTRLGMILCAEGHITDDKGELITEVTRLRNVNPTWLESELETYRRRVTNGLIDYIELEALNPNGPDWDYAENACLKMLEVYEQETQEL